MKKLLLTIIAVVFIQPLWGFCAEIPESFRPMTAEAIKNGRALYEAYLQGPRKDVEIEKLKSKIDDFCSLDYNAYSVGVNTYFIAESPSPGSIVFGRHYKVSDAGVIKSTDTCFTAPPPSSKSVAAYITHRFDTPSEFHVFVSLKHNKHPIYVLTVIRGIWKVQNGGIAYMGQLE